MRRSQASILVLLAVVVAAALSVPAYQTWRANVGPTLSTPYHAVLLANGGVFFGRIENLQSEYPVLRDVFYVQSQTNPDTGRVTNSLVKRGQEGHAPDRMILNRRQIVLIEPVTQSSQVGKLIGGEPGPRN